MNPWTYIGWFILIIIAGFLLLLANYLLAAAWDHIRMLYLHYLTRNTPLCKGQIWREKGREDYTVTSDKRPSGFFTVESGTKGCHFSIPFTQEEWSARIRLTKAYLLHSPSDQPSQTPLL